MKNEIGHSKLLVAQKVAEKVLMKERNIGQSINAFFAKRTIFRNGILILVFIVLLILNLLSFKYL
jgi:hypothetical protein